MPVWNPFLFDARDDKGLMEVCWMERSDEVVDAVLGFYRGVSEKAIDRFDEIVSSDPATLVIGTAIGEWVTERPRLRFGFEAEGVTIEAGPSPSGWGVK